LAVPEVLTGNIFLLLAASLVLMLRGHPWAVVLPLLTKVTPGVGVVIFIVRRDWKSLAVACSAVGVVFTLSALLDVDPWWHWATMLVTTGGEGQRWLVAAKAVVAVVLVVLAERLDRPWLIVVGVLCAMPVILGPSPLALLLAIPRLRRRNRVADDGDAAEDRGGHVPVLQR
jgi:archaellum biogenesis protein FlaJ (TadC family)